MSTLAHRIESLLPQTQCRECGFNGCTPYAEALAAGMATINLCPPGGETVMRELAALLHTSPLPLAQANKAAAPKALAMIDETACIGCTACIKACPVDAILGATKQMHSVIADECTGCGLCLPPCPVDCIVMQPVADAWLPRSRQLAGDAPSERAAAAAHARERYQRRNRRLARLAAERQAYLAARRTAVGNTAPTASRDDHKPKLDPAALIAQAMARAQSQQTQRSTTANRQDFQQQQLERARQQARYRNAQRDLQYGNTAEQAAALAFLRQYKAEHSNTNTEHPPEPA